MHERIIRTTHRREKAFLKSKIKNFLNIIYVLIIVIIFSALLKHLMANEEETMMTDLLQKDAIPFDDQGQQVCVYLNHI